MKNLFENWRRYLLETDGQKAAARIPPEIEPEDDEDEDPIDIPDDGEDDEGPEPEPKPGA